MNNGPNSRIVGAAAFFVVVAAIVYITSHIYDPVIRPILDVLPPFLIAFVFAFLLDPIVGWIQKRGGSREFGVAIVGLMFLVAFVLVGFELIPKVADQAGDLANNFPKYYEKALVTVNGILQSHKPLLERFHLPSTANELATKFSAQTQDFARRSLGILAGFLSGALSKILWIVIIPLATLWLLRDMEYIKAKLVYFTPSCHRERLMNISAAIGEVFGKYVRGMIIVSILFSVVASIVLSAAGLNYALIIGGVSGLLYQIPYIGTMLMVIITGIAAVVQPGHGIAYALILMGIMGALGSVIFDLLITPKIVGKSVGIHPLLMLFSLMLGGQLFGILGLILAVPIAASIQVAMSHFYPRILDNLRPSKPEKKSKEPRKHKRRKA